MTADTDYFRNYLNDLGHVFILPKLSSCCPLLSGLTGTAYSVQLIAVGSETPLVYTISGGALPTGLSLSSSGLISGTPSVVQTATFTIRITDFKGNYADASCSIQIISATVTSFSDALTSGDAANPNIGNLDGSKWIFGSAGSSNTNTPTDRFGYDIGLSSIDSINCLQWSAQGATNPQLNLAAWLIPIPSYIACYGQTQFAQATMIQTATSGSSRIQAGLGVLINSANGGLVGYDFYTDTANLGHWTLARYTPNITNLATGTGIVNGDILRLSADLSVNGQVTLTVLRNGSQLTQYVDSSASRLLLGSPALIGDFPSAGTGVAKSEWRTFSCGVGL